ncbi:uncharacterized protein V1516DRAFT_666507 [Lipomyces oligophaga]|uniref:uncharacterized protein n=1 Tax=Lipomyces oligophaga TaxID=45792 RepID=UPI0034CD0926
MSKSSVEKIENLQSGESKGIQLEGAQNNPGSTKERNIKNPFEGYSKERLWVDAETFAIKHNMADLANFFQRGALAAQNPDQFEHIPELLEEDRDILRNEIKHKWRQPKALYMTVIICSLAAAIQGWDQTGSNGANLSYPQVFGIADSGAECEAAGTCDKNSWIIGAISSAPYMAICIIACWFSDPINNLIGRRATIFIGAIFGLLAPIGQALAQTWPQILVCRILLGLGMGLKEVSVPVFSAETAPTNIRGAVGSGWYLFVALGILLGFSANLAVVNCGDITWRLQLGSAFIPSVPLLLGVFFTPESPRWLIRKGRHSSAYQSLLRLRGTPLLAARDTFFISSQIELERTLIEAGGGDKGNFFFRCWELLSIGRNRRAAQASGIVMVAQQFSGINIMAFYSSTVFSEAGASNINALLASWGFGLAMVVFAIPALYTIDTWGRRPLLLFTFPNMAWALLATGFSFYIPVENNAHLGLIAFFIYVFVAFYSPGEGPCSFLYSSEVFPLSHREVGMSWAVATNNFWAVVIALTFPPMLKSFGAPGSFGFFAGLNVLSFLFIFLFVPETKQRTLEELDETFEISTRKFARYQVTQVLPWWFKKYVLLKKNLVTPDLYQFEQEEKV